MPNIQAKTGQKAVDLLRYFQKGNGAQKPYQYIAGDSFLPGSTDCGFYITLRNALVHITTTRVRISRQFKKNRFLMDTPYRDKGFAINVPTMLVNSRRHHAFMSSRNTCPPSIRHHALKMFAVD